MKETAVSLLAETTTEGRRAPREALWMDRNADSFLRGTLGVPDCTPDPIRHAAASTGASTSKGGGTKLIGRRRPKDRRGLECARNAARGSAAAARTYLCALNAYVSILPAFIPVSPADLSVKA